MIETSWIEHLEKNRTSNQSNSPKEGFWQFWGQSAANARKIYLIDKIEAVRNDNCYQNQLESNFLLQHNFD